MSDLNVLSRHETEFGETMRAALKRFGVPCELIRDPDDITPGFTFTRLWRSLYRYVRPSNGQVLWLIEIEIFVPPDAQIWRTWVIDQEPTDEQILTLAAETPDASWL
jgi:hypothetical protein